MKNSSVTGEKKARDLFYQEPYHRFKEFIDPKKNRFDSLCKLLNELSFHYSIVQFGTSRHFFVSSPLKVKPSVVFLAHYDATPESPGANDNASSVFQLIALALELRKIPNQPWLVVFTDKEEISADEGLQNQGSFLLATGLKNTDLAEADFYVFDACGRGGTLIVSSAADHLIKKETGIGAAHIKKKLRNLRNQAISAAEKNCRVKYRVLPTPFSDDAGFLRAGLVAQTISVLPEDEAASFARLSRVNPAYVQALINREFREGLDMNQIPLTWRLINSPRDCAQWLSPEYFPHIVQFAFSLATIK
ncbi:MAG: Zn-dependent exopeptidase M28 [Spirochaetaceae bacterium]|jgi:hypothetical protein|nr:Zn-dependent exopeptidase M28 [Spirochaetaceae bacterium]